MCNSECSIVVLPTVPFIFINQSKANVLCLSHKFFKEV